MVNVLILHPDLGIGGAERLIIDVALALKSRGDNVAIVTNHHDAQRCFIETIDGTFSIMIVASWFPRSIFGKCIALCAYLRFLLAALYCVVSVTPVHGTDVIICDQISVVIPLLRRFARVKVLFYCHFPDKLLSHPGGYLKRLYRKLIDTLEECTMGNADRILVNSKFTAEVFTKSFPSLARVEPAVLYPSIAATFYDNFNDGDEDATIADLIAGKLVFLSLNRFEEKKNHRLAIDAFISLKQYISLRDWNRSVLVIAGGFDERLPDNVSCYRQLESIVSDAGLDSKVHFFKSIDEYAKMTLLARCLAVVYTPSNEHFGIVPLEAMRSSKPVIAVNSGGPRETVVHEETGFLIEPKSENLANCMAELIEHPDTVRRMGENGRRRFNAKFGFTAFSAHISAVVDKLAQQQK